MKEKFLQAKHWQMFLLTFGIPILFQFFIMGSMFLKIESGDLSDINSMSEYMRFLPVVLILFLGVFYGWFWSVAVGLQHKLPANVRMKTKRFKFFFFLPLVYLFLISLLVSFITQRMAEGGIEADFGWLPSIFGLIVPLHFFSMFSIFYSLYFVAKTVKTVELQRETSFSDFAGEFFLIWFYPIGIWIVQPKINKMIQG